MGDLPKSAGRKQLNFLLPISGRSAQMKGSDAVKLDESRRRLMGDLERTGLRTPRKS